MREGMVPRGVRSIHARLQGARRPRSSGGNAGCAMIALYLIAAAFSMFTLATAGRVA